MIEAVLTRIRTVIAPWYASKTGGPYVLRVGDDGICRLHLSDESILHETASASDMLDWVEKVNACLEARINGATTINSPARGRGRPLSPEVTERRRWVAETT